MTVRRVVANIAVADPAEAEAFYGGILGMDRAMDLGWIVTFATDEQARAQVSFAAEGGSGTPVPALSVEVDDLDEVLARVHAAGLPIAYGPTVEPWGVRRFFLHDPFGTLVNVLTHI